MGEKKSRPHITSYFEIETKPSKCCGREPRVKWEKKRVHDDDDDKMEKKRQVNDICLHPAIERNTENQTNRAPSKIVNIVTHTHL